MREKDLPVISYKIRTKSDLLCFEHLRLIATINGQDSEVFYSLAKNHYMNHTPRSMVVLGK